MQILSERHKECHHERHSLVRHNQTSHHQAAVERNVQWTCSRRGSGWRYRAPSKPNTLTLASIDQAIVQHDLKNN